MSQVDVTKISTYVAFGPADDAVTVPKLSIYVWLEPGNDVGEEPARQGFCYGQKVRRG